MRHLWRDFSPVIDVTTGERTRVEPPAGHQMFFLVNSLRGQHQESVPDVVEEHIRHRDIFYVKELYNRVQNHYAIQITHRNYVTK